MKYSWFLGVMIGLWSCHSTPHHDVTSDMLHFPATASGEEVSGGPQMVFDSDTFHFDMMAVGTKVAHTFQFKNVGNAPLIISHVQPSCGCTALKDWPDKPIAAGESGQISIEFNATGSEGEVNKTVWVATNGEPKDKVLHIVGKIIGVEVQHNGNSGRVEMKRER